MRFATQAIHAGITPDATTGAIVPPITLSTTFERGNEDIYSRTSNPNRTQLETTIASLEGASHCLAYASGMAAIHAVMSLASPGDTILSISAVYGGTFSYLAHPTLARDLRVNYVDAITDAVLATMTPAPRLVWLETPTNPTLRVTDIAMVAETCRARGIWLVVDNTFSSPALTQPLMLGAHFVVHSATKYLNGHADVTLGVVLTHDDEAWSRMREMRNLMGAVPSPFDCWLCARGVKTLPLRIKQASESALRIAQYLLHSGKVASVMYPALPPYAAITARQHRGGMGGGMVSFRVKPGVSVERLCGATRLFKWAVSLGSVESLIEIPASALTHRAVAKEFRERIGIHDDLIRISVGCEDVEDLLEDLEQALAVA